MTREEVVNLMASSTSDESWDENCDTVKAAFGGYPAFWWEAVMQSGLYTRTVAKWGSDGALEVRGGDGTVHSRWNPVTGKRLS